MLAFALQHEIIVLIMFLSTLVFAEIAWANYLNRAYTNQPEYEDEETIGSDDEEEDNDK